MRPVTVDAAPEVAAAITAAIEATLGDEARCSATVAPRPESAWRRAGIVEAVAASDPLASWRTNN